MEENNSLKKSFEEEVDKLKSESILSPEYKRKKLILWLIRTTIAIILYVIFWKFNWVKWTLVIYIPLALFSLLSIYGVNFLLNKKIEKTRKKMEELDNLTTNTEED